VAIDIELYRKVYSVRAAENLIIKDYHLDEMKTPMHMSRGEEALVCAVEHNLPLGSLVATTYRSHALYLARTGDFFGFFCEMLGRVGGCSDGRAGSMHLGANSQGMLSSSAIIGGNISVAVGAAFALSREPNNQKRSAVFFGDGATDAGTFWESLNLASLYKTPTVFVCCDNQLAVHTDNWARKGWSSENIGNIVTQMGIHYLQVKGACAFSLSEKIGAFFANHSSAEPLFIHGEWFRFLEHVGIDEDFSAGYRQQPSVEFMAEWDPVKQSRASLLSSGYSEAYVEELEQAVESEANSSLFRAREKNFAERATLTSHVLG